MYIFIKYNIFCFLVFFTFYFGSARKKLFLRLEKARFQDRKRNHRQTDNLTSHSQSKENFLESQIRKAFSKRKRKHGKLQISLYELREDLLKRIYYVRRRSFCCCCCFFLYPQFHQFFCRAFFALSACKLFFMFFSFYVFSCYGIKVEKTLSAPFQMFTFGLVKIFTRQIVCLFVTSLPEGEKIPRHAAGIQSIFIRIESFSKCIIFLSSPLV